MPPSASRALRIGSLTRWLAAAVIVLAAFGACQEVDVTAVDVMSVEVSPSTASITVGQMRQLSAVLTDATGHQLRDRTVSWSSDNQGVATVDGEGRVRGMSTGNATITASAEGRSGQATISVTGQTVATVEVSPPGANLRPGESVQLQAVAKASDGSIISGRPVAWSSENNGVVTVNASGLAAAAGTGSARVTATIDGQVGASTITVGLEPVASVDVLPGTHSLGEGESFQFQVILRSAAGDVLTGRAVTWASTDQNVATVDVNGRVTAVRAGNVRIRATSEGRTGEANLTVTPPTIATVEVAPTSSSVLVGGTVELTATAKSATGAVVPGRTFVWTSSNANVASVNAQGQVTGHALGDVTITATADGRSGTARVFVADQPVATVEVTPATGNLIVDDTLTLTGVAKAVNGTVLINRVLSWSSSDNAIATITGTGATARLRATGPGTVTITATSEGRSGTAQFTIAPKPVANVAVVPNSANIVVDGTTQLQAVLTAADNTNLTGRVVTWATSAANIATVDATGLVRGVSAGIATITATSEGKSGQSTITVGLKPVDVVRVQPPSANMIVDDALQITVTLLAADQTVLTGRVVTWSSSNANVARVDANGRITAVAPGNATITATSEGKTGSVAVTVSPKPVATVTVEPPADTLLEGETVQLAAVLRAADNTILTGRVITWSSSAAAVADVDNSGKVTARAPGVATITATSEGKSGTSRITVNQVPVASVEVQPVTATVLHPGTQNYTAIVKSASGAVLTNRQVTWRSLNPTIVSVTGGPGLASTATATSQGVNCTGQSCTATIEATAGGVPGTATLVVLKPIATIVLSPATATLTVGGASATIQARVEAADGTVLTGRTLTWSSSSANATVQAAGGTQSATVQAINAVCTGAACTLTVTASAGGKSGTATITIPKPVGTVQINPSTLTLDENKNGKLEATVRATDGTLLTDRNVTWSSSNTSVATVNGTGPFNREANVQGRTCPQGSGSCSATITATAEGKSGTATVTVEKRVAAVQVQPASVTLAQGRTSAVKAVVTASDQTVLTNRAVTWTSAASSIASVAGTGQFGLDATVTGVGVGNTTIRATAEGVDGTAVVTVVEPVATLQITPDPINLVEGGSTQLHASVKGPSGAVLADRTVTWSATPAGIATVTGTGQFLQDANLVAVKCPQGSATCTVQIRATAEGVTGTATLTVSKQVATVNITPDPVPDLVPNGTVQLNVAVRADDNTDLSSVFPAAWSSSDASIASVTPTGGLVTAVSATCAAGVPACSATITATAAGRSDAVTVRVLKQVQAIVLSPDPTPELTAGQTVQLTAKVTAADGTDLTGTRTVLWASDAQAVARVSTSGLVTAVGTPCAQGQLTCRARITAVVDNVSQHVDVFVAKTVDRVDVSAANGGTVSISGVGGTVPSSIEATAFPYAADGTLLTNRTVTWTKAATGVIPGDVTINPTTGNPTAVTGVSVGTVRLTATVDGKAGSTVITVIL